MRLECSQVTLARNRYNGPGVLAVTRLENPTILITRPEDDAERFLTTLRAEAGSFEVIICPAFWFEEVPVKMPNFDVAIFTSRTGVSYAPQGNGRLAYCVGDATAQFARDAGYISLSATGSADELVALILEQAPTGSLLHIRGEKSLGNVTERLAERGINCSDAIAYRKVLNSPTQSIREAVRNAPQIVIPLFSAETVSIVAGWRLPLKSCVVVAISNVVANSAMVLKPTEAIVSESPDMRGMTAATARLTA